LVAVDPGRTDMVYAVIGDRERVTSRYAMPTRTFVRRSGRAEAASAGEWVLARARASDGRTLLEATGSLPSRRDIGAWGAFLAAYLPLLDDLLRAKRSRRLRRTRFNQHLQRDRVLDQVIKELLGGSLSRAACSRTHVALGDAKVCSTGFGHAPASQSRLHWRMVHVHKIAVTTVDEFRTSRVCHRCQAAQLYPTKSHGERLWKLRCCPKCRNTGGTGPLVMHRDYNAAMNIRACFLAAAAALDRPAALRRGSALLPSHPRDFNEGLRVRR
jgi:hypothetical protein